MTPTEYKYKARPVGESWGVFDPWGNCVGIYCNQFEATYAAQRLMKAHKEAQEHDHDEL